MSRARVLAVDDERFFREAITDVLSEAGFEVVVVGTGTEALEMIEDTTLGVAVLDLQLPDMHGLEVFRQLKDLRPDMRVVILSAHTDQDNVLEALRLGAFDYLAKPLHEEELRLAVTRALETHELHAGWGRLRERLSCLDESVEELRAAADGEVGAPQGLRQLAVDAAASVLGAARTSLMLLDEDAAELHVAAAYGRKLEADDTDRVAVGSGVAGQVALHGEALVVADIAEDGRFNEGVTAGRYASGSFAVAPLAIGARTLGVLCAADPTGGKTFGVDDLSLLRLLASQLAQLLGEPPAAEPVLEFVPAPEEPEDARGAELARAVCEAVTTEIEPARVLAAALRPVADLLGAAPAAIFLTDHETGELRREAEQDGGYRSDREGLALKGLTGAVMNGAGVIASDDPSLDPRFEPEVDTPSDGRSGPFVCVPLQFRGIVLGVARVFPEDASAAAPELAEVLAATLSAAVRNVILYRSLVETIDEVAEVRRKQQQS
jgi:DNA-binding response OmpR family regulator